MQVLHIMLDFQLLVNLEENLLGHYVQVKSYKKSNPKRSNNFCMYISLFSKLKAIQHNLQNLI